MFIIHSVVNSFFFPACKSLKWLCNCFGSYRLPVALFIFFTSLSFLFPLLSFSILSLFNHPLMYLLLLPCFQFYFYIFIVQKWTLFYNRFRENCQTTRFLKKKFYTCKFSFLLMFSYYLITYCSNTFCRIATKPHSWRRVSLLQSTLVD